MVLNPKNLGPEGLEPSTNRSPNVLGVYEPVAPTRLSYGPCVVSHTSNMLLSN
jgi:hypothetical protein